MTPPRNDHDMTTEERRHEETADMETLLSTHDAALHNMAMDDLAELVPPGEEHRVPERVRSEVTQRHGGSAADNGATSGVGTPYKNRPKEPKEAKPQWCKYELTEERERIIRASWDGTTRTIRAIGEQIGVPWYTVRDWGQDKLHLPNPSTAHPKGAGNLGKAKKAANPSESPTLPATTETPAKKAHGNIPWADDPDDAQLSEIEAAREKRNAMIANASPDDVIRADSTTGWLTPKWGDYTDAIGEIISAQWDGGDASLAQLAERERFPLGVLRGWIDEHRLKPKAPKAASAPNPELLTATLGLSPASKAAQQSLAALRPLPLVTPLPEKPVQNADRQSDPRLERFTTWLDGEVGGEISVFLVPAPAEVVVLRGPGGYRVLTPRGDWPDEPISRKLVERIVRLLASGASEASVYGVVYQAEA